MFKLYCTKCNYKFEKDKIPQRCPYCGNNGTVKKQLIAQDILNEVTAEEAIMEQSKKERE